MDNSFYTSKSRYLVALLCIFTGAAAASCEARGGGQAALYGSPIESVTTVDYNTLKAEVLAPYCMSCHNSFGSESGIAAYVTAGNPGASPLYTEAASGDMPPGGPALSSSALAVINAYITQLGSAQSQKTPPADSQGGTLTQVSFDQLKKDILQPLCIKCHSNFGTASGIQDFVKAGDPDDSPLYSEAKSGAMPPSGPALTDDQLSEMSTYISGLSP